MQKIRRTIDKVLAWFLIGLMGIAVLNVLWQVFTRWVLQDPSSYTEELARYLLIWIGLLGAAYAAGLTAHAAGLTAHADGLAAHADEVAGQQDPGGVQARSRAAKRD